MLSNNFISAHILAGGVAGLVEVSVTHPLDYMKVSMQQRNKIIFKNMYRGILTRYTSVFPMRSILWSARKHGKTKLKDYSLLQKGSIIGSGAGVLQTFVDAPLENIKIQKMYNNNVKINPNRLIQGFVPNMFRNAILCTGIITGSLINGNIGLIAGTAIGCLASQPFDYLKTIKQTGIEPNYKDMMKGWQHRIIISPINMFIGYHIYKIILDNF